MILFLLFYEWEGLCQKIRKINWFSWIQWLTHSLKQWSEEFEVFSPTFYPLFLSMFINFSFLINLSSLDFFVHRKHARTEWKLDFYVAIGCGQSAPLVNQIFVVHSEYNLIKFKFLINPRITFIYIKWRNCLHSKTVKSMKHYKNP